MNTYTIEQLKNSDILIHLTNKEQAHKIIDKWKLTCPNSKHDFYNSDNFTVKWDNFYNLSWVDERTHPNWFENRYKLKNKIEFSQIDFEENIINNFQLF